MRMARALLVAGLGVLSGAGNQWAGAQGAPVAAVPGKLPTPAQLFERHNDAVGGRAAMAAYRSVSIHATVKSTRHRYSGVARSWIREQFWMRPDKFLVRDVLPDQDSWRTGFDGRHAWTTRGFPAGVWLTGAPGEAAVKERANFLFPFLDLSRFTQVDSVERSTLLGRPAYQVRVIRYGGAVDTLYFDSETGYEIGETVRSVFRDEEKSVGTDRDLTVGEWRRYVICYSDYQSYGKIRLPRITQERISPTYFETTTIERVEFNSVPLEVFSLPSNIDSPLR